jgi:TM2 domain-containing membrane protein YozV
MPEHEPYDGTHSLVFGYLLWLVGFTGAHRFYYGKVASGILWFFTLGLLGIGWLVDIVLIPDMDRDARQQFAPGSIDYNAAWLLLIFLGPLGLHRFLQGKYGTGLVYLLTCGLLGTGVVYDVLTLNDQIHARNFAAYQVGTAS